MFRSISILFVSLIVSILNFVISLELFRNDLCIRNDGVAFGIDIKYITILSLSLVVVLIFFGLISKGILRYILFSFVLLGISNLSIRIMYGSVCDYIHIFNLIVNISDILISVLLIYAFIDISFLEKKK